MCGYLILNGGVDFNDPIWRKNGLKIFTTIDELITQLEEAKRIVKDRTRLFNFYKCNNFEKYQSKEFHPTLKRTILVFDEAAEFLDKSRYITKEDQEKYIKIVNALSSLAGISRAFGCHLCTITQRPSAKLIPEFLRTNSRLSFLF